MITDGDRVCCLTSTHDSHMAHDDGEDDSNDDDDDQLYTLSSIYRCGAGRVWGGGEAY